MYNRKPPFSHKLSVCVEPLFAQAICHSAAISSLPTSVKYSATSGGLTAPKGRNSMQNTSSPYTRRPQAAQHSTARQLAVSDKYP